MSKIWDIILKKKNHEFEARDKPQTVENVCGITINEFKKRTLGIEIFSEVLNENVWFCSDEGMAEQIQNDDPGAVCYTADELSELIDLDPSEDFLKKIHNAKSVFEDSRIIKTKKKEDY